MRATIVFASSAIRRARRLTDDPKELAYLSMDHCLRFLIEHPSDLSSISYHGPAPAEDVICLSDTEPPLEWTSYRPTGGLNSWMRTWSPAEAGLYGMQAKECQYLVWQGVDRERAAKLIRKWQSLKSMVDNLPKISPKKLRPLIVEAWDKPKEDWPKVVLADLHDFHPDTGICAYCGVDAEEADDGACLGDLVEFPHLKLYIDELARRNKECSTEGYTVVQDIRAATDMVNDLSKAEWIALDTETTGLDPWWLDPVGISLSAKAGRAYYIPIGHETDETQLDGTYVRDLLRQLLVDSQMPLVVHNAPFDLRVMEKVCAVSWRRFVVKACTQLMSFVTGLGTGDEWGTLKLDNLALRLLGIRMQPIEELIGERKQWQIPFSRVLITKATPYACEDADMTGRIFPILDNLIDERGVRGVFDLEMEYLPIVVQMEENGVAIDLSVVDEIDEVLTENIEDVESAVYTLAGHEFKIQSPEEMSTVLYDELQLPPGRKVKTGYSTEKEHLKTIVNSHPIVQQVLDHRESAKLKSTYVDNLQQIIHPITKRLHVRWNQCGTASGRLSSSGKGAPRAPLEPGKKHKEAKINIQNQPARSELGKVIRKAFIAGEIP